MTKDEIKRALKSCSITISPCRECPFGGEEYGYSCREELLKEALNAISEQEAKNEELQIELKAMRNAANGFKTRVTQLKGIMESTVLNS